MAPEPQQSFCILNTEEFNFISSWQGAVYVDYYITGRFAVWAQTQNMHDTNRVMHITGIESPEAFIDAVSQCCSRLDNDDGFSHVLDHMDDIEEMAPEFAASLEAWIDREDDEPLEYNPDGTIFVPTINQLMKPPAHQDLELLILSDKPATLAGETKTSDYESRVKEEVRQEMIISHGEEWVNNYFEGSWESNKNIIL